MPAWAIGIIDTLVSWLAKASGYIAAFFAGRAVQQRDDAKETVKVLKAEDEAAAKAGTTEDRLREGKF